MMTRMNFSVASDKKEGQNNIDKLEQLNNEDRAQVAKDGDRLVSHPNSENQRITANNDLLLRFSVTH